MIVVHADGTSVTHRQQIDTIFLPPEVFEPLAESAPRVRQDLVRPIAPRETLRVFLPVVPRGEETLTAMKITPSYVIFRGGESRGDARSIAGALENRRGYQEALDRVLLRITAEEPREVGLWLESALESARVDLFRPGLEEEAQGSRDASAGRYHGLMVATEIWGFVEDDVRRANLPRDSVASEFERRLVQEMSRIESGLLP